MAYPLISHVCMPWGEERSSEPWRPGASPSSASRRLEPTIKDGGISISRETLGGHVACSVAARCGGGSFAQDGLSKNVQIAGRGFYVPMQLGMASVLSTSSASNNLPHSPRSSTPVRRTQSDVGSSTPRRQRSMAEAARLQAAEATVHACEYEAVPEDAIDVAVEWHCRRLARHASESLQLRRCGPGEYEIGGTRVHLGWRFDTGTMEIFVSGFDREGREELLASYMSKVAEISSALKPPSLGGPRLGAGGPHMMLQAPGGGYPSRMPPTPQQKMPEGVSWREAHSFDASMLNAVAHHNTAWAGAGMQGSSSAPIRGGPGVPPPPVPRDIRVFGAPGPSVSVQAAGYQPFGPPGLGAQTPGMPPMPGIAPLPNFSAAPGWQTRPGFVSVR